VRPSRGELMWGTWMMWKAFTSAGQKRAAHKGPSPLSAPRALGQIGLISLIPHIASQPCPILDRLSTAHSNTLADRGIPSMTRDQLAVQDSQHSTPPLSVKFILGLLAPPPNRFQPLTKLRTCEEYTIPYIPLVLIGGWTAHAISFWRRYVLP
jgi:hypothetical protein